MGSPDGWQLRCQRCGEYEISRTAAVSLPSGDQSLLPFLSAYTRQAWEFDRQHVQINTNWQPLAELHARSSMAQKLDKLMAVARRRTANPGESFEFLHQFDYPLVDAPAPPTCAFLLSHAVELGLLSEESTTTAVITFKGWEYLESVSGPVGRPKRVFVAMSFHESLDEAFALGIHSAVEEDCGLTCIRVDRLEHNEKICDRILAEIRRCDIVVADFTLQRPGVYFEAGFALALNRTVIWTVRQDEIDKVHFDTRQYNHIVWSGHADLRSKLASRIHATLPEAARHS